jgi:hypothetical protein
MRYQIPSEPPLDLNAFNATFALLPVRDDVDGLLTTIICQRFVTQWRHCKEILKKIVVALNIFVAFA